MEFFDWKEFFDWMNMVEHEAVVGEEETIPAYSELIPAIGELYSPMKIDFYPHVQPTSPFFDRPLSPLWNLEDNNYDYSARGGHPIRPNRIMFLLDDVCTIEIMWTIQGWHVVLKLDLHDGKGIQKAMKRLSSVSGVEFISMDTKEKKLTVVGDFYPVQVVSKLRKLWHTDIILIVGPKKAEKKKDDGKKDEECRVLSVTRPSCSKEFRHSETLVSVLHANQICNAPLEVASGKVLEEAISVKTTKFSGDNKLDSNHESPQGPQDYPNGGDMVQIDSSEQQPAVEFDVRHNGGNIVIMGESDTPVAGSERKNAKNISKRKHRNTETLISPELLQQLKGRMTLDEIAECTGASRSSIKRFCRTHEIPRWPRKRNESVQGVQGAPSQPCLAKDPLNDGISQPAKLNKSNQQNLSLAFRQMELSPSAPYCVSNTPASMQPQISAERMLTEVPGCPKYLKFLHHSKKGKGVLESNETVGSCSNPTPEHTVASVAPTMPQAIAMQDASTMTIKVRYRHNILKFTLSFSSGKRELEENISKRLKLKLGTFEITYEDADGDWVGIYCDEDLQLCMGDSKRLGKSTIIMSVES